MVEIFGLNRLALEEEKNQMQVWHTNPFNTVGIVRGEGSTVWDETGKAYLDLLSGCWCNVLGYSHPRWVSTVQEQVSRLTHIGPAFVTREVENALEQLIGILPPQLNRAVFVNTGSEAVELALKMARAATRRNGIVVNEHGYYGATTYTFALSEAGRHAGYLPQMDGIHRIPAPHCEACACGHKGGCQGKLSCLDRMEQLINSGADLAAVLYLPLLGSGIITPPLGYAKRLRDLTSRAGALLIAEEVTTGMGRTGRWFGFQHEDIVPDILVIGKAIGGGLPIAAVVTTEEVEQRCRANFIGHVQSHQNDPFSGAIAAAVISIMREEGLVDRAAAIGEYFRAGLEEMRDSGDYLTSVRGRGLMLGAELSPSLVKQGPGLVQKMLQKGFIMDFQASTSTFRFFPPYVITKEEIEAFLDAFATVLGAAI